MKEIVFKGKSYQCPEKWEDVTIAMLIKAHELNELLDNAFIIAVVSAYTGIPINEIKSADVNEIEKIVSIMSFIANEYKPVVKTSFEFNGNTYSCEDDLTKQKFEDFVSIQTALHNHRDEPVRVLPKLLAIYCKKDGEVLDDFDLNERAKEFENVSMTTAKDIEAFFLASINAYRSVSLLSSTTEVQKELVLHKVKELESIMKQSKEQTGGFSSTRLLIGISQLYLKYFKRQLEKYFNSWDSKPSKKTLKVTYKKLLMKILKRKNEENRDS